MCDQTINHQLSTINQDSIFDIAARLQQNYHKLISILTKLEQGSSDSATLDAERSTLSEIRKHLILAERVTNRIIEAHAIEQFKQIILDALAQAAPAIQKRVIRILANRSGPS